MYHTVEMAGSIAKTAPELIPCLTACAIDAPGPDTTRAVASLLADYEALQVAARADPADIDADHRRRFIRIDEVQLADLSSFARTIAALLLPGGVLVQDIHLSTLGFISRDRWWESIYAAATVRGMYPDRPPAVRFLSNKRGYAATFGRDLMDAGFDPRDVMDKAELDATVVPAIARDVRERFPLLLEVPASPAATVTPLGEDDVSHREVDAALDLVEWNVAGRVELGGRLLNAPVVFRAGSQEGSTWQALIDDRFRAGEGVPVLDVGLRLAAAGAERAEVSNLAARHIHALRARLTTPGAIITANHAYRLDERLLVARVRRR